ncbi:16S rRNA (cytidine(1402)-2'-O)-methyltransferase [Marinibacterium sp. SX1]|uniref:16S rRNA (cytidine(1402)-2'-O)-methyltransferase n=1 Tax=Marinibacterium sp. SX1 TaxID=3388424 RepID=UPI003D17C30A
MNFRSTPLAPGLHFVGTPIGTARDITLRALDVLASADVLAAEDTRSLRHLMEIHGVPLNGRTVLSYHDHSGAGARERLMQALAGGQSVAYASEAGMPLIADPGYGLSRAAAEAGHLVTSAPGPSAVLTALTLAGLPTDAFFFDGFLPSARTARRNRLAELREIPGTLVFYESPKRIAQTLADAAEVLGPDRPSALARELTKKFEEIRRGGLGQLAEEIAEKPVKGEIVLVVDRARQPSLNAADLEQDLRDALQTMTIRDAADLVSRAHGLPRRQVYQAALKMEKD